MKNNYLSSGKLLRAFFLLAFIIVFDACDKDDEDPVLPPQENPEAVDAETAAALESIESITFDSEEVTLPNGLKLDEYLSEINPLFFDEWGRRKTVTELGPQDTKNLLVANMTKIGLKLSALGIPYGAGLKDYKADGKPTDGQCNLDKAYKGLDCSGLLYQMFVNAGIKGFPTGKADLQRQVATLESNIKGAIPEWSTMSIVDNKQLPESEIEPGDIIYWSKVAGGEAFHIGMVVMQAGQIGVIQSNGAWEDCDDKGNCGKCAKNLLPGTYKVGVRFIPLARAIAKKAANGFSDHYGIVRINAGISGKWDVTIKCQGANFDFLTLNLDFPTAQTNSFHVDRTAIYESQGILYNLSFDFKYNKETNLLECIFKTTADDFPNFYRFDTFAVELKRDEESGIPATLGESRDAGCGYDIALSNQTKIDVSKLIKME